MVMITSTHVQWLVPWFSAFIFFPALATLRNKAYSSITRDEVIRYVVSFRKQIF